MRSLDHCPTVYTWPYTEQAIIPFFALIAVSTILFSSCIPFTDLLIQYGYNSNCFEQSFFKILAFRFSTVRIHLHTEYEEKPLSHCVCNNVYLLSFTAVFTCSAKVCSFSFDFVLSFGIQPN